MRNCTRLWNSMYTMLYNLLEYFSFRFSRWGICSVEGTLGGVIQQKRKPSTHWQNLSRYVIVMRTRIYMYCCRSHVLRLSPPANVRGREVFLSGWIHLRASMGQERRSGLALLHIHQDVKLDINQIIDLLPRSKGDWNSKTFVTTNQNNIHNIHILLFFYISGNPLKYIYKCEKL